MVEAVAKFDFTGRHPEELTANRGDTLMVLKTKSDLEAHWYFGELNGRVGWIPENYIHMKPYSWFFESMSRKGSEKFLANKKTGNFVIRHAESSPTLGSYSLSVKYDDKVQHFKISRDQAGLFFIGMRKFKSLNELIEFHSTHSVSRTKTVKLVSVVSEFVPQPDYQADIEYNPHLHQDQEDQETEAGAGVAAATEATAIEPISITMSGLSLCSEENNNNCISTASQLLGYTESKNKSQISLTSKNDVQATTVLEVKSVHAQLPNLSPPLVDSEMKKKRLSCLQPSAAADVSKIFAKAMFDFNAEEDDELAFKTGQVIRVTNMDHEEWWQGNIRDQPEHHGQFPASHVIILKP